METFGSIPVTLRTLEQGQARRSENPIQTQGDLGDPCVLTDCTPCRLTLFNLAIDRASGL
jgi:hypothetical protein